jgi:hypothetical protein
VPTRFPTVGPVAAQVGQPVRGRTATSGGPAATPHLRARSGQLQPGQAWQVQVMAEWLELVIVALPGARVCRSAHFHAVPFHRSIRILPPAVPTAQAFRPEDAATPNNWARAGLGLRTCFQAVPFQRSIRVFTPPLMG